MKLAVEANTKMKMKMIVVFGQNYQVRRFNVPGGVFNNI